MESRYKRIALFAFAVLISLSLCLGDAQGQQGQRRKRRTRKAKPAAPKPVITNPTIAPASEAGSDVKIVSTAEDGTDQESKSSSDKPEAKKKPENEEDMQQTVNKLSNQVDRLNNKLSQIQENDRAMVDLERLTRAEQRAESLRAQLLDNETKMADLQARLDQIEFAIKPENIERSTATYGSTRPEEAREALRRSLQNDKTRVENQIKILENGKSRLEQAITTADAEVDLIRRKLDAKEQQQQQDSSQSDQSEKPAKKKPQD
jgi:DNA repair exonuclease SbcCD ATPase subunit